MKARIPLSRPYTDSEELAAVTKVLKSSWLTQGPYVKNLEDMFCAKTDSQYAIAVTNGTSALELGLISLGIGEGDIILTTSHSFIATANCIVRVGAIPFFADVLQGGINLSPEDIESTIKESFSTRTEGIFLKSSLLKKLGVPLKKAKLKAILTVHQYGQPCDLMALKKLCKRYKLLLIEDSACAIGSKYDSQPIGSCKYSDLSTFSLHPRKIITCGEGGIITTNKKKIDKVLRLYRHHGMDTSDVKRHNNPKLARESYKIIGTNARLSDLHASVALAQMKKLDTMLTRRKEQVAEYLTHLEQIQELSLPFAPFQHKWNYQSLCFLVNSPSTRDRIKDYLLEKGIVSKGGIPPIHKQKAYQNYHFLQLPESEKRFKDSLLLPIFHDLTIKDIKKITRFIKDAI